MENAKKERDDAVKRAEDAECRVAILTSECQGFEGEVGNLKRKHALLEEELEDFKRSHNVVV